MQRLQGHLQLDQEHLSEAKERLESLATARTAGFQQVKRKLVDERERVRKTIADLQRQLKEAMASEDRLDKAIAKEEERIATAREDLVQEQQAVAMQAEAVAEQKRLLTEQVASIAAAQRALDTSTQSARAQVESLDEAVNEVKLHIVQARLTLRRLERRLLHFNPADEALDLSDEREALRRFDGLVMRLDAGQRQLLEAQKAAAAKEAAVHGQTSRLIQLQQDASSAKKQLEGLAEQLPELKQAKTLAVSGRNFKEAARLNGDIAALTTQQEEAKALHDSLEQEVEAAGRDLQSLSADMEALQDSLSQHRGTVMVSLLDELVVARASLARALRRATRRKLPLAAMLQLDLTLCRSLVEELCLAQQQCAPEEVLPPETDEDPDSEDTLAELDNTDLGVIAASLIDLDGGQPESASQEHGADILTTDSVLADLLGETATGAMEAAALASSADGQQPDDGEGQQQPSDGDDGEGQQPPSDGDDGEGQRQPSDGEEGFLDEDPPASEADVESSEDAGGDSPAAAEASVDGSLSDLVEAEVTAPEMEAVETLDDTSASAGSSVRDAAEDAQALLAAIGQKEADIEKAILEEDFDLCEQLDAELNDLKMRIDALQGGE